MSDALAELSFDTFAPLIDQEFRIGSDAASVLTTLTEVKALGQAVRAGGAFSLLFVQADTTARILQQGCYPLSSNGLAVDDMFLVPIGPVPGGFGYQAIFM